MSALEIIGLSLVSIGIAGMIGMLITSILKLNPFSITNKRLDLALLFSTIAYGVGIFGAVAVSIIHEFVK